MIGSLSIYRASQSSSRAPPDLPKAPPEPLRAPPEPPRADPELHRASKCCQSFPEPLLGGQGLSSTAPAHKITPPGPQPKQRDSPEELVPKLLLRAPLLHAPGARMTIVKLTPSTKTCFVLVRVKLTAHRMQVFGTACVLRHDYRHMCWLGHF